jgi:hypothetical protein
MLAAAQRFLVLAMVIAHSHNIHLTLRQPQHFDTGGYPQLARFLDYRIFVTLANLLHNALQKSLVALDKLLMKGARRTDWPAICLTLCLISFAVESMQVDAHLRRDIPGTVDTFLDPYPIDCLSHVLKAHSHGFSPLWLDWNVKDNATLVEGNASIRETLSNIQYLSQEYG